MFILLVITSVCRSINSCYLSTFQIYLFVRSFIYWFFYFIYLHCNIVSCYFHCFYYEFSTSSLEFRLSKNHRWSRCERILKNITIKFLLSFFFKVFWYFISYFGRPYGIGQNTKYKTGRKTLLFDVFCPTFV